MNTPKHLQESKMNSSNDGSSSAEQPTQPQMCSTVVVRSKRRFRCALLQFSSGSLVCSNNLALLVATRPVIAYLPFDIPSLVPQTAQHSIMMSSVQDWTPATKEAGGYAIIACVSRLATHAADAQKISQGSHVVNAPYLVGVFKRP